MATFGLYVNMFYVWEGDVAGGSQYFAISQNILQILGIIMLAVISKYLVKIEKKKLISLKSYYQILFTPTNIELSFPSKSITWLSLS